MTVHCRRYDPARVGRLAVLGGIRRGHEHENEKTTRRQIRSTFAASGGCDAGTDCLGADGGFGGLSGRDRRAGRLRGTHRTAGVLRLLRRQFCHDHPDHRGRRRPAGPSRPVRRQRRPSGRLQRVRLRRVRAGLPGRRCPRLERVRLVRFLVLRHRLRPHLPGRDLRQPQ